MTPDHNLSDLVLHNNAVDSSGLGLAAALARLTLDSIPALRRVSSLEVSTNFDVHYYIAIAVYHLSNGSAQLSDDQTWDILEFLFGRVPRTILTSFLHRNSLSMRAAWERLISPELQIPRTDRFKKPFKSFMELGMHNKWIDTRRLGHIYLYDAACMDYTDVVQRLLNNGCRLDTYACEPWRGLPGIGHRVYVSTIIAALNNENIECARLLIEYCEVNRVISEPNSPWETYTTNFCAFIRAFQNENELYSQALCIFLKNAADVDGKFYGLFCRTDAWDRFSHENDVPEKWHISVLDGCFYVNRPLFKQLRPYTKIHPSQMTRAGILGALELGLPSLQDYLGGVRHVGPGAKEWYLQLILAEQFSTRPHMRDVANHSMKEIAMDPNVALVLLQYGVDPTLQSMKNPPDVGFGVVRQIHLTLDDNARQLWTSVLRLIIEMGISPGSEALGAAAENRDISLLRWLTSCTSSIADHGSKALAIAASLDDFEAVEILLEAGVDINSYAQREEESLTV